MSQFKSTCVPPCANHQFAGRGRGLGWKFERLHFPLPASFIFCVSSLAALGLPLYLIYFFRPNIFSRSNTYFLRLDIFGVPGPREIRVSYYYLSYIFLRLDMFRSPPWLPGQQTPRASSWRSFRRRTRSSYRRKLSFKLGWVKPTKKRKHRIKRGLSI